MKENMGVPLLKLQTQYMLNVYNSNQVSHFVWSIYQLQNLNINCRKLKSCREGEEKILQWVKVWMDIHCTENLCGPAAQGFFIVSLESTLSKVFVILWGPGCYHFRHRLAMSDTFGSLPHHPRYFFFLFYFKLNNEFYIYLTIFFFLFLT